MPECDRHPFPVAQNKVADLRVHDATSIGGSVGIPNGTWYLGFPFLGVYLRYEDGMDAHLPILCMVAEQ